MKKEGPTAPGGVEEEPFDTMILLYVGIALVVIIVIVIVVCVCVMMKRKNSGTTPQALDAGYGYELKNQTTTLTESNVDVINAGEAMNGSKNGNNIFYGNETNGADDQT